MTGRQGHHKRVLTDEQVRKIRELYASGATQQLIAEEFGVTQGHVNRIVLGLQRAAAGGPIKRKYVR